MLDPGWASGVRRAHLADVLLVNASLLISTSVIFFFVPNLWLLLPIHGLLAIVAQRAGSVEKQLDAIKDAAHPFPAARP
jgi:hypothetical protein